MNKERLLRLADLLEKDAADKKGMKFDIGTVGFMKPGKWYQKFGILKDPVISCGTTGCAMGLAALSGEFKAQGLGYRFPYGDGTVKMTWFGMPMSYDDAAMHLFDITGGQALRLFSPDSYSQRVSTGASGELEVARRIRSLVKDEGVYDVY